MITRYFVLDGESSLQHGIQMQGHPAFSAPVPRIEKVSVAGRNGDLIFSDGSYENIQAEVRCFILKHQSYEYVADANNWLSKAGYRRLSYDGDDQAYRLARVTNLAECSVRMHLLNPFTLVFDCKPQRFLLSGEDTFPMTESGRFFNHGCGGLPLIRAHGTGSIILNGKEIIVRAVDEYVDIDCDSQDAYKLSENKNADIYCREFPSLISGDNEVILSDGLEIDITPRWYTL